MQAWLEIGHAHQNISVTVPDWKTYQQTTCRKPHSASQMVTSVDLT